jgi:PEP-CTERM motif
MKPNKTSAVVVIGLALWAASSYGQSLSLNFSVNTGATLQFNGTNDSFQFNPSTNGYQWHITQETGGTSALGLNGSFLNGPFSYGPITSTGSGLTLVQQATVTGPLASLEISDGTGFLTGTVNLINIATFATSSGGVNANLTVNLTGVTYSGSNPDLQVVKAEQPGTLDLSFQFSPGKTLTQLSTGTGPYVTSFSGSLAVVPEPSTLALTGLGGLVLLHLRRRK